MEAGGSFHGSTADGNFHVRRLKNQMEDRAISMLVPRRLASFKPVLLY